MQNSEIHDGSDHRTQEVFDRLLASKAFRTIAIVFLAGLFGVSWFFVMGRNTYKEWELTLTVILQFVFVGIFAAAVGTYFRGIESNRAAALKKREDHRAETQKQRDKDQERRKVRFDALEHFREDLINTYHSIKKLRRTLRASSFLTDNERYCCERAIFEKLMDQIEETQLKMESLKEEVDARKELFGTERDELHGYLKDSEHYLRELLRQYEDGYAQRRALAGSDLIPLDDTVAEFIRPADDAKLETKEFFKLTRKIRGSVAKLMEQSTSERP